MQASRDDIHAIEAEIDPQLIVPMTVLIDRIQ